jgi:hypothetical protein
MLEAQDTLLAAIESQVGGTARATATASDRIKVAWEQMADVGGQMLMPVMEDLATQSVTLAEKFNEMDSAQRASTVGWIRQASYVGIGAKLLGGWGAVAGAAAGAADRLGMAVGDRLGGSIAGALGEGDVREMYASILAAGVLGYLLNLLFLLLDKRFV